MYFVQIRVFLFDHSDEEVISQDKLFKLPRKYNQLPYQVRHVIRTIHTYIQLQFDSAALTKVKSSDALQ